MLTLRDLFRVILVLPVVELQRRRHSLHQAAAIARRKGAVNRRRSANERARLRRAIAFVDSHLPGQPNCVRRTLVEIALDAGAAKERLYAGFNSGGGERSGHAWLESDPVREKFDAIVTI